MKLFLCLLMLNMLIEISNFLYNGALDANGFKQGGLGSGVTTLDGTKWSNWNGV